MPFIKNVIYFKRCLKKTKQNTKERNSKMPSGNLYDLLKMLYLIESLYSDLEVKINIEISTRDYLYTYFASN